MLKRFSLVVKELLAGIALFAIFTEVIVLLVTRDKVFYSVGLFVGLIVAVGMCIHMQTSLDDAIDMFEADAEKHIRKTYGLRTVVIFLILGFMYYFSIGSIITGFIGIMSLKVAAYLQPFTHKYFQKYIGKGR